MIHERNRHLFIIVCVSLAIVTQSFSFLFVKLSTMSSGFTALMLYCIGLSFVFLRTIPWQFALKYSDLSKIYPYMSFVQVLIFIYAIALFGENVRLHHFIGFAMMVSGVFILNRSR